MQCCMACLKWHQDLSRHMREQLKMTGNFVTDNPSPWDLQYDVLHAMICKMYGCWEPFFADRRNADEQMEKDRLLFLHLARHIAALATCLRDPDRPPAQKRQPDDILNWFGEVSVLALIHPSHYDMHPALRNSPASATTMYTM